MSRNFFRTVTRLRSLNSMNEFETDDDGLKKSISRFSKCPRKAKYFGSFEIHHNWYSDEQKTVDRFCVRHSAERTRNIKIKKRVSILDSPSDQTIRDSLSEMSLSKGSKTSADGAVLPKSSFIADTYELRSKYHENMCEK